MMKHVSLSRRAAGLAVGLTLVLGSVVPATAQTMVEPRQPSAPMVIDHRVFDGSAKGLLPDNQLILAVKLANSAWTSFFRPMSSATVKAFIANPTGIPTLAVGDVINVATSMFSPTYRVLAEQWPAGSEIILPVVSMTGAGMARVDGFARLRVEVIDGTGDPKYVRGTILELVLA